MAADADPVSVVQFGDPDDPGIAARRRVARSARTLLDAIVSSAAPPDVLDAAADALEAHAARLEPDGISGSPSQVPAPAGAVGKAAAPARTSRYDGTEGVRFDGGSNAAVFETHPILGPSNPMAPPVAIEHTEQGVVATATYDRRFEGTPGCVQGGLLAAAFDVVLGGSAARAGQPVVTGTLTIRYRRPTPLHTELRFEGHLDHVVDRQVFCSARVLAGDEVTAEAEAVFVTVNRERFRAR